MLPTPAAAGGEGAGAAVKRALITIAVASVLAAAALTLPSLVTVRPGIALAAAMLLGWLLAIIGPHLAPRPAQPALFDRIHSTNQSAARDLFDWNLRAMDHLGTVVPGASLVERAANAAATIRQLRAMIPDPERAAIDRLRSDGAPAAPVVTEAMVQALEHVIACAGLWWTEHIPGQETIGFADDLEKARAAVAALKVGGREMPIDSGEPPRGEPPLRAATLMKG